MTAGKILFLFTSNDKLVSNDHKTGWYLPEAAHPYYALKAAGYELVAASPAGGESPLDSSSVEAFKDDADSKKFLDDSEAVKFYKDTIKLSDVKPEEYVAFFAPGGHGPMGESGNAEIQEVIKTFYESGKPTAAVCHAPVLFTDVKLSDGSYLVKGKKVTGFSNVEEEQAGLTKAVPFLLETRLNERGALFEKADEPWGARVVSDGNLYTGQNPASAGPLAARIIEALKV